MSEFSESYHLRTERQEDACELLRRRGATGYVFPVTNGWVTFVAQDGSFAPDPEFAAAAQHPLLHYVSAEDHGWSFTLFEAGGAIASAYACDWNDDLTWDDARYSRAAIEQLGSTAVNPAALDEFEKVMRPADMETHFESETSYLFADAVGLENYQWLSFDYAEKEFEPNLDQFPGVVKVDTV